MTTFGTRSGVPRPDPLARLVHGRRGRRLGLTAALTLIALVVLADIVEGPGTAYLGVLTAAPLLAAVLTRPRDALAVGGVALLAAHTYALTVGTAGSSAQLVRLAFLTAATALAVLAARLRQAQEQQLHEAISIAEVAQATILRPVPSAVGALTLAARYRSAAAAARIGGDFYDVADTEFGVRILLGDVRGKGLDAVQLAAAVLGSFREAAHTAGPDLAAVARALDRTTTRHAGGEDFVTALLLQFDLTGHGQMVRCGHPPPLRITTTGVSNVRTALHQPPLGLLPDPTAEPLQLHPGERLLLFTDGLSEARTPHGDFLDVTAAAQPLAHGPLDAALQHLVDTVDTHTAGQPADDLGVLLLEQQPIPAPEASTGARRTPTRARHRTTVLQPTPPAI